MFEDGAWDGGVIEISVDGGAWQDVEAAGGVFSSGYNGVIVTNDASPISTRNAYVNTGSGNETVSFGTSFVNQDVRLRFRLGSDAAAGAYGWEIDNVSFTGIQNRPFSMLVAETQNCGENNQAPVASVANASITADEQTLITLDASSSTDADSNTLSFTWSQLSGPMVNLAGANTAVATFTSPTVDTDTFLEFEVTVSDGQLESKAQVQVTITSVNQAPVASVSAASQTVNEGANVNLDASGSSDSDGDTLSYQWVQTSGPTVSLSNASSAQASFTAPQVNANTNLIFEVTVSDGSLESSASTTVVVRDTTTATPPPTTTPETGGGGGGGSLGWLSLLLLFCLRRYRMTVKPAA